jgi:hypothetical protein
VIDKNPVARLHFPDRAQGLGIAHAVPDRLPLPLKLFEGVRFGIGFCEKIPFGGQFCISC